MTVMNLNIKVKKLYENAILPTKGSTGAAGYDLYAYIPEGPITIAPHSTVKIGTGIAIEPPEQTFGAIFARSGLSINQGLRPANCVGICDEDYRGEYIVALYNDSDEERVIENGERIAQVIFISYYNGIITEVSELSDTDRGDGAFGSTGK